MFTEKLRKFHFWCHKVLPLVYDNSLSYYEVLCKLREIVNELVDVVRLIGEELDRMNERLDVMEEEFARMREQFEEMLAEIARMRQDIAQMLAKINEFEVTIRNMQNQVDSIGNRMDGIDDRMDGIDSDISSINNRLGLIENNVNDILNSITDITSELQSLNSDIDVLSSDVLALEERIDNVENNLRQLRLDIEPVSYIIDVENVIIETIDEDGFIMPVNTSVRNNGIYGATGLLSFIEGAERRIYNLNLVIHGWEGSLASIPASTIIRITIPLKIGYKPVFSVEQCGEKVTVSFAGSLNHLGEQNLNNYNLCDIVMKSGVISYNENSIVYTIGQRNMAMQLPLGGVRISISDILVYKE